MNLDELKGKTIDDALLEALKKYESELVGKIEHARNEQINSRKTLKANYEAAQSALTKALEKLGVESPDDLDSIPDAKGAAEAARQFEAKLKRMERELQAAVSARDELQSRMREAAQKAALTEAIAAHQFIAPDLVADALSKRLVWEGDELLFRTQDGKLMPVADGVTQFAKTRTDLLKPTGAGGAGMRSGNAGGGGGKVMTEAEFNALPPKQQAAVAKDPTFRLVANNP